MDWVSFKVSSSTAKCLPFSLPHANHLPLTLPPCALEIIGPSLIFFLCLDPLVFPSSMFFRLRPPHSGRLPLHHRQFTRLLLSSVPFALPFLCVFLSNSSSEIALLFDTLFPLPLPAQAPHLQRHLHPGNLSCSLQTCDILTVHRSFPTSHQ